MSRNQGLKTKVFQIVIVGAGQIGSRHLQALGAIDRDILVCVCDPNPQSLDATKKRFEEIPPNLFVNSVRYVDTLNDVPEEIDVAIVATNADVRKGVIEQLLERSRVNYFILEKVAFQCAEDFESVIKLLKDKGSKAWVNCSYRRMFPLYQAIRKNLRTGSKIIFNMSGGGWGLACNSIHLLDIFSYLIGETKIKLDGSHLDPAIGQSKREGFIELTGTLKGMTSSGSEISLLDYQGTDAPHVIQILSQDAHFIILETEGKVLNSLKGNGWKWQENAFSFLYQSQLTHLVIKQILDTQDCALTSLQDAFCLHQGMLEEFIKHLQRVTGKKYDKCPIT